MSLALTSYNLNSYGPDQSNHSNLKSIIYSQNKYRIHSSNRTSYAKISKLFGNAINMNAEGTVKMINVEVKWSEPF